MRTINKQYAPFIQILAISLIIVLTAVLQEARAAAESIGSHRILWQTLATLSDVESKLGNLTEAVELRQHAREEINYLAGNIASEDYRASFLNRPDIQAILI